jgi:hypothetical protein
MEKMESLLINNLTGKMIADQVSKTPACANLQKNHFIKNQAKLTSIIQQRPFALFPHLW